MPIKQYVKVLPASFSSDKYIIALLHKNIKIHEQAIFVDES
jgi:hypothetical protein